MFQSIFEQILSDIQIYFEISLKTMNVDKKFEVYCVTYEENYCQALQNERSNVVLFSLAGNLLQQ